MESKTNQFNSQIIHHQSSLFYSNYNVVPRLARHADETGSGLIVEVFCETCRKLYGIVQPKVALKLAGPDSDVGRQILEAFPDWRNEPPTELTDIMKRAKD